MRIKSFPLEAVLMHDASLGFICEEECDLKLFVEFLKLLNKFDSFDFFGCFSAILIEK